jgi:hypothetical protein
MRKLLIPLVVGLTILVSQVVTGVSAQTPDYSDYEVSIPYVAFTEPPTAEPTDAAVDDGTWQAEKPRSYYCSPEALVKHPQMLNECFPDKWEWVCFPEGHCEMYRRDLDPLGIFATPAPMPTPEPLPTAELTPEPTPILVPTPEATDTVVAP